MLSYSQNGYSKDFLVYGRDPEGLLLVLVLHHCANRTKAKMEMACSIEEAGREVDTSVDRTKAKMEMARSIEEGGREVDTSVDVYNIQLSKL